MLCDKCGRREASIHLCEIRRGIPSEYHICEDCADMFLPLEKSDVADMLEQLAPMSGEAGSIYMEKGTAPGSEELAMTEVGQHILVWKVGETQLRRVDPPAGRSFDPVWSPDSRHLAHVLLDRGRYAIRVITPAGELVRQFFDVTPGERAQWTPDGQKLCFSWGRGAVRTPVLAVAQTGSIIRVFDKPGAMDFSPVLSPDGTRMAILSTVEDAPSEARLGVFRLDNLEQELVVELGEELTGTVSWSPDGSLLAVPLIRTPLTEVTDILALASVGQDLLVLEVATRKLLFEGKAVLGCTWRADNNELVMAVESGDHVDLVRTAGPDWPQPVTLAQDVVLPRTEVAISPALWSARDGKLAVIVGSTGNTRLVVDGKDVPVPNPRLAAWRPGTEELTVLVESIVSGGGHEVLAIRPDEPDKPQRLLSIPATDYFDVVGLTWSPDGNMLAIEAHRAKRQE